MQTAIIPTSTDNLQSSAKSASASSASAVTPFNQVLNKEISQQNSKSAQTTQTTPKANPQDQSQQPQQTANLVNTTTAATPVDSKTLKDTGKTLQKNQDATEDQTNAVKADQSNNVQLLAFVGSVGQLATDLKKVDATAKDNTQNLVIDANSKIDTTDNKINGNELGTGSVSLNKSSDVMNKDINSKKQIQTSDLSKVKISKNELASTAELTAGADGKLIAGDAAKSTPPASANATAEQITPGQAAMRGSAPANSGLTTETSGNTAIDKTLIPTKLLVSDTTLATPGVAADKTPVSINLSVSDVIQTAAPTSEKILATPSINLVTSDKVPVSTNLSASDSTKTSFPITNGNVQKQSINANEIVSDEGNPVIGDKTQISFVAEAATSVLPIYNQVQNANLTKIDKDKIDIVKINIVKIDTGNSVAADKTLTSDVPTNIDAIQNSIGVKLPGTEKSLDSASGVASITQGTAQQNIKNTKSALNNSNAITEDKSQKTVASQITNTITNAIENNSAIKTAGLEKMQDTAVAIAPAPQSFAQQLAVSTNSAAGAAAEHLAPRVGSPAWDQAVGQKVVWMVAGGQQTAELTLNPPDLGPLRVVLSVNNDQASATFTSAQPDVRAALEAALPRLREMMSDAGMQLSNFSVNSQSFQQGNTPQDGRPGSQRSNNSQTSSNESGISSLTSTKTNASTPVGIVDTFA
ncbi:flagellar hook-length control protein FliK [Undibacterium sp. RTI2.1]|uniref:flagellar hook-length control protein FliK n=1 Tax=unclassified Undibacterium TaxID=2630295 RepID=UPI002AB56244|nr:MULTISPECIES: flagellar hook-length control protein FliK [unclassified Undibacterium]MDY7537119.1 flagellar hook-length control protein FliK [Undibacterium sp. 5I1]MEB0029842.1 flagellar hook-length control protein FliK [Undibacterium sp. RTI2.1]MEB0115127.1 flagellar hook-length control protein FliK [Undibacterium sp. RTI2.2]MEB0229297.1 flagellar hook-length control protein FliK [Undibacterium sp. 10I3]MEB0256155.1 flagellar hook-length control protein FliK [Undibacterium sp. 5I1]